MTPLQQKAGHVPPLLRAFKGFPFQRRSRKSSPRPAGPSLVCVCHLPAVSPSSPPQGLCTHCLPSPSYTSTWLTSPLPLSFCSDATFLVRLSWTTQKSSPSSLPVPALCTELIVCNTLTCSSIVFSHQNVSSLRAGILVLLTALFPPSRMVSGTWVAAH